MLHSFKSLVPEKQDKSVSPDKTALLLLMRKGELYNL